MSPKSRKPPVAPGGSAASTAGRRFGIRRSPFWRPLLILFGATAARSYVLVEEDSLEVRFGFFHHRFAREPIMAAHPTEGRWWYGIGWHTDLVHSLMLNGTLKGMVELELRPPELVWLLFLPIRCSRLYLSLEDPEGFVRAFESRH
jgi:hypothetical protein